MSQRCNELGQPIGDPLPDWTARPFPPRTPISGAYCTVEPLDAASHSSDLYRACSEDAEGSIWTYLAYGPFDTEDAYREWVSSVYLTPSPSRNSRSVFSGMADLRFSGSASARRRDFAGARAPAPLQ